MCTYASTPSPAAVSTRSTGEPPAARLRAIVTPHLGRRFHHQPQLGHLLIEGQRVALDRGRETALRRQAQLVQRHELGSLVDPALQVVPAFQCAALRRDEAEYHHLSRGYDSQRLECAG